jgi:hypothetical protein
MINLTRIEIAPSPSGRLKVYKHLRKVCGCKDCQADRKAESEAERASGVDASETMAFFCSC